MKSPPKIVFVANLWTLAGHPTPRREWSPERKLREIAAAGFDAVTAPAEPGLKPVLTQHRLRYTGFFSSSRAREFPKLIRAQREAGAENLSVQLGDDDTSPRKTLALAQRLLRGAKRQGSLRRD